MVLIKLFSIGQRRLVVVIVIISALLTELHFVRGQQNINASAASSMGQSSGGTNTIQNGNSSTIGHTNATATTMTNNTIASNSTIFTTTSATPTTFPVASYPSTGALQGTAQAPFPGNGANGNKNALGPDDSYIASAPSLLPSTLLATCMVAVLLSTAWLL